MIQPTIVTKPSLTVVGLEGSFIHALSPDRTNFEVIPCLWGDLFPRTQEVGDRVGQHMFGVVYGRAESERKHPDELQYIAAVEASATPEVPNGMVSRTIPETSFAVFTHRGLINKIGETVHEIYRVWLPESGYEHSEIADIELYDSRFDHESEQSEMECWISVAPGDSGESNASRPPKQ